MEKIIWGIDPGSSICGVSQLRGGSIGICFNEVPERVYERILRLSDGSPFNIVIEDIYPYSLRLTPAVIDTCKLIGELTYRFGLVAKSVTLVPRNSVKKWIFDTFPEVCTPRIEKKMLLLHARKLKQGKRGLMKKDGEMYTPSFQYVDDRIVIAAMKSIHNIPTPKPGKPNIYGLKSTSHAWQALAVCSFFYHTNTSLR